jgi:hypothetical protein
MPPALSEEVFDSICDGTEPRRPHDKPRARAALSRILLEEYPNFRFDRSKIIAKQKQAETLMDRLRTFTNMYRSVYAPLISVGEFEAILTGRSLPYLVDDIRTEHGLWCIAKLWQRIDAEIEFCVIMRRANERHQDTQRVWLYHRLCTVWLDHFAQASLEDYNREGGQPSGPLIEFILRSARQVLTKLPSREAIRDNIERERGERLNAHRIAVEIWEREGRPGVPPRGLGPPRRGGQAD